MDLDGEDDLIVLLEGMRRSDEGWRSASPSLSAALGFKRPPVDGRIASAVDGLLSSPALEADTATLAARTACLSRASSTCSRRPPVSLYVAFRLGQGCAVPSHVCRWSNNH